MKKLSPCGSDPLTLQVVQKATANARPVAAHAHGAKGVIAAVQVGRIGMAEVRSFRAPCDNSMKIEVVSFYHQMFGWGGCKV